MVREQPVALVVVLALEPFHAVDFLHLVFVLLSAFLHPRLITTDSNKNVRSATLMNEVLH